MKKIYVLDIQGTNTANVRYALQNEFEIISIKEPSEIIEHYPNIVLPGNGSFGYYVSFLKKNKWKNYLKNIIENKNKGKLFSICSGFQSLGKKSEESKDIKGLELIDYSFYSLKNYFNTNLVINIGRKEIFELNETRNFKELKVENKLTFENYCKPYFVHGYGAELDLEKAKKNNDFCYLYYEINKQKLLGGILSENFCATQFHPELSGDLWQQFMINFFK